MTDVANKTGSCGNQNRALVSLILTHTCTPVCTHMHTRTHMNIHTPTHIYMGTQTYEYTTHN